MRSPAAAIAWEFRQRHRWGFVALAVSLVGLATLKALMPGQRVRFDDAQTFALLVVVPMTAGFLYFLAVFSFGLGGDLAARESMYPARMFTLPVTPAALAGWPMLFGMAAMAALWFAVRLFGVWPAGKEVPVIWPALLAASLLAWTQALTWMPYPFRGLRVIVAVLWLAAIDAVVLVALALKASEPVMLAILAPHVPLAFIVARSAIARARRGDTPDWRGASVWLEWIASLLPRRRDQFSSPESAQAWFEWRQHGRSLPAFVGILLPFELALLFIFRETPAIIFETIAGVLLTPPLMATFAAAATTQAAPQGRDAHGLTPFIATRPLTNAVLIAAKLKMALRSTLMTWVLVLTAIPLALRLSGTAPVVIDWTRSAVEVVGVARTVASGFLGLSALLATTWKQLVQGLYIGLTGRDWFVKGSVFLTLSLVAIALPVGHWIVGNGRVMAALWNAFAFILAAFVCMKVTAAAWIAVRLHDTGLSSDRTILLGLFAWDAAVLALYALLKWLLPELLVRSYFLALVAILAVPLARLSAAPLALDWNRHR